MNASYLKNGQKVTCVVSVKIGKENKPVAEKLAEYVAEVFTDSTASAFTAKRFAMTQGLLLNVAAFGNVDAFVIDSEIETIVINAKDLGDLLPRMVAAMQSNQAYRETVAPHNTAYDKAVTLTSKGTKEAGQRGRKSQDLANVSLSL